MSKMKEEDANRPSVQYYNVIFDYSFILKNY